MGVNEKMTAIADAIREKTGGTEALGLDAMAESIGEVYEAGQKSEYDDFWDVFQNNGNRTSYRYAFYGVYWKDSNYNPKYKITCSGTQQDMFYQSGITDTKVEIDLLSGATTSRMFGAPSLVTIRKLKIASDIVFLNSFQGASLLENMEVAGTIGNDVSFSDSKKLSRNSITSIINALSDTTSGKTVTFSKTAKEAAFTADEWATLIATKSNWTIALV